MKKNEIRLAVMVSLVCLMLLGESVGNVLLEKGAIFVLGAVIGVITVSETSKLERWCMSKGVDIRGINEPGRKKSKRKAG